MDIPDKVTLLLEDYLNINDKLQKWVKLPIDQVLKLLKTLESSKISKKDLKDSKLHLTLNAMVKTNVHSKEQRPIIDAVKRIREIWKQHLQGEGAEEKKAELANQTQKQEDLVFQRGNSLTLERTISIGQLQLPDLKDGNRNHALKKLAEELSSADTLAKLRESDPESKYLDPLQLSDYLVSLEAEMYKHHKNDYSRFARERVLLLKNKLNQQLKYGLLEGSLSILEFATKESHELESAEIKKLMEEGHQWKMKALQSDFYMKNIEIKEGEFQCGKCKSKKIASTQKQMRSADEPMTTFFHCTNCHNRWKIS